MESASKREEAAPQGGDTGEQRVVLIVDDDPAICEFITDALEEQGYRTVCARDGREALAAVGEINPDLILLDVQMPGIDGWDVLRQLRAQAGPHKPIVVMTGRYEGQDRALSSGAQGYLAKPFGLDDLLECVDLHSQLTIESNLTERMSSRDEMRERTDSPRS